MYLRALSKHLILIFLAIFLIQCSPDEAAATRDQQEQNLPPFKPDVEISLTAEEASAEILPGPKTSIYRYDAQLIKGDPKTLEKREDSYLGPIIRVKRGTKMKVHFKNSLPRESIIHWHGLHVPPEMDGHPRYAVKKGESYIYQFTVNDRPGTYWFHPHPDKITGLQVYQGLAGMLIVEDESVSFPTGEYDQPLILQDRTFDQQNQLVYLDGGHMQQMLGFLGSTILINGSINRDITVDQATYRFRVLNGSNSRIYKLAWSDGSDVTVIATDGGFLEKPVSRPYVMLAPGERIELWKNFAGNEPGDEISLLSLQFRDGSSMPMGRMAGSSTNGSRFTLANMTVSDKQGVVAELPESMPAINTIEADTAINADSPREFRFAFERMRWVINGKSFEMDEVAPWEKVTLDTTEVWRFINEGGSGRMGMMSGGMMQLPHPVHIHGLQFQILKRDTTGVDSGMWQSVKEGFIDSGWQDTFLLLPGMKVDVIMRFTDYTGMFIYHCHNLEHEDMGMMRNYEVVQ